MTDPRQLLGPDGEPVKTETIEGDAVVVHAAEVDAIPTTVHGFTVRCGLGPYPPDTAHSHRRAMYVEMLPVSKEASDLCSKLNKARLLGCTPLTQDGAAQIAAEPNGGLAESVALDTLRAAVREIRRYLTVPRQTFEPPA